MTGPVNLPKTFYSTDKVDFTKDIDASKLKDKSIVVTGGAKGLGEGCVVAFAEAGAYITILDLDEVSGNALVEQLSAKGHHVQFQQTDVTSFASQVAGFKSALVFSPSKTIDIVITSAGVTTHYISRWLESAISSDADPDADPPAPSSSTIDINLTGTLYSTHLALYYFKKSLPANPTGEKQPSKQLIFVSSLAGYLSVNDAGDYEASKYGVRGLWKSIRYSVNIIDENAPFRTNLIAPTYIETDMTRQGVPHLKADGIEVGEVADVVAGVMRVACDETVFGRAVAVAKGLKEAGDRNFDLGDDWVGGGEGRVLIRETLEGGLTRMEQQGVPRNLRIPYE